MGKNIKLDLRDVGCQDTRWLELSENSTLTMLTGRFLVP